MAVYGRHVAGSVLLAAPVAVHYDATAVVVVVDLLVEHVLVDVLVCLSVLNLYAVQFYGLSHLVRQRAHRAQVARIDLARRELAGWRLIQHGQLAHIRLVGNGGDEVVYTAVRVVRGVDYAARQYGLVEELPWLVDAVGVVVRHQAARAQQAERGRYHGYARHARTLVVDGYAVGLYQLRATALRLVLVTQHRGMAQSRIVLVNLVTVLLVEGLCPAVLTEELLPAIVLVAICHYFPIILVGNQHCLHRVGQARTALSADDGDSLGYEEGVGNGVAVVAVDVGQGIERTLGHYYLEVEVGGKVLQGLVAAYHGVCALASLADVVEGILKVLHGIGEAAAYLAVYRIAALAHLLHHVEVYVLGGGYVEAQQ